MQLTNTKLTTYHILNYILFFLLMYYRADQVCVMSDVMVMDEAHIRWQTWQGLCFGWQYNISRQTSDQHANADIEDDSFVTASLTRCYVMSAIASENKGWFTDNESELLGEKKRRLFIRLMAANLNIFLVQSCYHQQHLIPHRYIIPRLIFPVSIWIVKSEPQIVSDLVAIKNIIRRRSDTRTCEEKASRC